MPKSSNLQGGNGKENNSSVATIVGFPVQAGNSAKIEISYKH